MQDFQERAITITGDFVKGIFETLETFMRILIHEHGNSVDRLIESQNFSHEREKFSESTDFDFQSSFLKHQQQLKAFDEFCEKFSFQYSYEQKPINLRSIMKKSFQDLTMEEHVILKKWTYEKKGKLNEIPHDFKITFAEKDTEVLGNIINKLNNTENKNLKKFVEKAKKEYLRQNGFKKDVEKGEKEYDGKRT